jgi:hypothetical protein
MRFHAREAEAAPTDDVSLLTHVAPADTEVVASELGPTRPDGLTIWPTWERVRPPDTGP